MSWTDERIDRLKKMWSDGATASQIAEELGGVSRNAVIGKAHRLGLDARPSPVKPGEEKEKKPAAAASAAKPAARDAAARRATPAIPRDRRQSIDRANPAAAAARRHPVSLDRPRRLRSPGPRRHPGADPARPAAAAGSSQAERRGRRQDQPARFERPHLQVAAGPSRRARLPFLRQSGQPRLPLLRRALRRRLPGPAAAPRPPSARRRCRSAGPGFANKTSALIG